MKKSILTLLILISSSGLLFSNTVQKSDTAYLELWVYYSVKQSGITAKLYIDIGTSKSHPLYGIASNGQGDNIVFKEDGITKVFSNEVDLLKYLSDSGWSILNIQTINIISRDYTKYLMIKAT